MNYLGIDYGSKRVGVAKANSEIKIATPLCVLKNDRNLLQEITKLIEAHEIETVVIGLSKDGSNELNSIAHSANEFAEELKKKTGLNIIFEDERYTTQAVRRFAEKGSVLDASAAALILQSYLDRME